MMIDAATAMTLAGIVLTSTQGVDSLTPQLPLQIVDRGESWLVEGTPYTDKRIKARYVANYIFIRKDTAEVVGIGSDARMIPSDDEKKKWAETFNPAEYDRIFGPRTRFEPGGETFAANMLMNLALYGGLINQPENAMAYAHALMRGTPRLSQIPTRALRAIERSHVWHIVAIMPGVSEPTEIMTVSRETGKVLSGDL